MHLFERDFPNVLYHYAPAHATVSILKDNAFRLNAYFGGGYQPDDIDNKRFYYLSTTRTPTGQYHRRAPSGALIVLDRDKIRQNHAIRPMEYYRARQDDRSEAEDRIVSNKPRIENASKYILEIHIGISMAKDIYANKWDYLLAKAYFAAKQRGIPVYFYENTEDWMRQRKDKAVTPDVKKLYDRGRLERIENARNRMPQFPRTNWLAPWLELYHKNKKEDMSERGQKLLYELQHGWYTDDLHRKLANDIQNEKRNPTPTLHNLIAAFRELGVRHPKEYMEKMKSKWAIDDS